MPPIWKRRPAAGTPPDFQRVPLGSIRTSEAGHKRVSVLGISSREPRHGPGATNQFMNVFSGLHGAVTPLCQKWDGKRHDFAFGGIHAELD